MNTKIRHVIFNKDNLQALQIMTNTHTHTHTHMCVRVGMS
jgi:hypothetical protein